MSRGQSKTAGKMNEQEIKQIVSRTVEETLLRMGLETSNPMEVQRDLQHLRAWRQSTEAIKRQSMLAAIGVVTAGLLALVWQVIRN